MKDNEGRTPLHEAAKALSVDAVKVLIEVGAPANIQDNKGQTPIFDAMQAEISSPYSLLMDLAQLSLKPHREKDIDLSLTPSQVVVGTL
jgi:ankyrin repeat protein